MDDQDTGAATNSDSQEKLYKIQDTETNNIINKNNVGPVLRDIDEY